MGNKPSSGNTPEWVLRRPTYRPGDTAVQGEAEIHAEQLREIAERIEAAQGGPPLRAGEGES